MSMFARRGSSKVRARAQLASLRRRIIDEIFIQRWREVWFWPSRDGVSGFMGTAPVMFVGLNPSAGSRRPRPKPTDAFFYATLRKYRLQDAHLTDAFKVRAGAWELPALMADETIARLNRSYLLEEVRIVRPRAVVAMGWKAFHLLREWRVVPEEILVRAVHPAWGRWGSRAKEMRARFRKVVVEARKRIV